MTPFRILGTCIKCTCVPKWTNSTSSYPENSFTLPITPAFTQSCITAARTIVIVAGKEGRLFRDGVKLLGLCTGDTLVHRGTISAIDTADSGFRPANRAPDQSLIWLTCDITPKSRAMVAPLYKLCARMPPQFAFVMATCWPLLRLLSPFKEVSQVLWPLSLKPSLFQSFLPIDNTYSMKNL